MMEIQIKKAVRAGNSSAVLLPRAWLDKEVRVELLEKTPEKILHNVIEIAKNHINLESIIGVYLAGSYARKEEDEGSDIDILIVTKDIDKKMISDGIYNILIISLELLNQKLKKDLLPIGQMLREAKPLLNSAYLDSINIKATKRNVKWYIETTEGKLNIIKKAVEIAKRRESKYLDDIVAYTLVLRIRTLHIIEKLIKNEEYSKKEFMKLIRDIGGENAYERYLAVKNNSKNGEGISIWETDKLYGYLKDELNKVKNLL